MKNALPAYILTCLADWIIQEAEQHVQYTSKWPCFIALCWGVFERTVCCLQ